MSKVILHNSFIPPDNKLDGNYQNKAFATPPLGAKRVSKVSTEVAKSIRPLLKGDWGTITPITEVLEDGTQNNYLARVELHYHPPEISNKKWHKGVTIFSTETPYLDDVETKPYNQIPKADLLAKNENKTDVENSKPSFVKKLNEFLDKMLG